MAKKNPLTQHSFFSSKIISTLLFVCMFLAMSFTSLAVAPQDLILQARYGYPLYDENVNYAKDTLVIHEGSIYNTLKLLDGKQVGLLDPNYFINTDSEKYKPPKNTSNYKQLKTKDKTKYTGEVALVGTFTGNESFVTNNKLMGIDGYQAQEFEVTYYTGNDNVKYSIYHYDGMTDNHTLARKNGTHMFDVYSKDGFITYNTTEFTTQIASVPDFYVPLSSDWTIPFDDYFAGYDSSFVSVSNVPAGWGIGYGEDIYYGDDNSYTNPDLDIFVGTSLSGGTDASGHPFIIGDDIMRITSYTDTIASGFEMNWCAWDAGGGEYYCQYGDTNMVYVVGSVSQIASIANVAISGSNQAEKDWDDFFNAYETIEITYNDGGLVNLTQSIGSSTPDSNYGTNFDTTLDYTSGTIILYMFGNNVNSGPTTVTVKAIGYDSSEVTDTFTVTTTATTGGGSGSGGDLENNTIVYYSFDNDNISSSNPLDLSPNNNDGTNNGATTGQTGILNQAFTYDGTNDYISSPIDDFGTGNFSINLWFKEDNLPVATEPILSSADTGNRFYINMHTDGRIYILSNDGSSSSDFSTNYFSTNNWHMMTLTRTGSTWKFYMNSTLEDTWTLSSGDISSSTWKIGAISTFFYDGSIDEFSVFDYVLNQTEINFLYNSGSPTDTQQYPFLAGWTEPPYYNTTVGFPNPFTVTAPSTVEYINFGARWYEYDNLYLYFTEPTNSSLINITTGDVYNGTYFEVIFNTTTETAEFYPLGNKNVTLYSQACNTYGCNESSGFTMVISGFDPPTYTGVSINNVTLYENESNTYFIDNYFNDFTYLNVTYYDNVVNSTVELTNNESQTNGVFQVSVSSGILSNLISVNTYTGYNQTYNLSINVSACNSYGCVNVSGMMNLTIQPDPTLPPVQDATIASFTIEANETYNITLEDFYTNATYYNISFENPATLSNQTLSLGQTVDAVYWQVSNTLNVLQFESYSDVSASTFYVQGCNDNGCTNVTTFSITVSTYVAPPGFDDMFDEFFSIFGSGSEKMRFFVGSLLVLAFFIVGWWFTGKTMVGGGVTGVIGFITAVVFGLIPVWVLVVTIISLVILLIIYSIFKK